MTKRYERRYATKYETASRDERAFRPAGRAEDGLLPHPERLTVVVELAGAAGLVQLLTSERQWPDRRTFLGRHEHPVDASRRRGVRSLGVATGRSRRESGSRRRDRRLRTSPRRDPCRGAYSVAYGMGYGTD